MATSYPSLPTLNDEELTDLFGDDSEAIRRYRLLFAVLIMGASQREAATAHSVSERTVRNVLRAYRSVNTLESLRSRRSVSRRTTPRRWEAFEPALATALAEDAMAGGDKLWRRAQELLGEYGDTLSRRTAYRILGRLRNETRQSSQPGTLFNAVRTALPLLAEDPPITLGGSTLSQRLLPDEDDQLLRGTLLQQALRTALDRLRPAGSISVIDRSWWPYLICTGEYEAGQPRAELQQDLALSASTYSRAKRHGLIQIANQITRILAPMVETPTTLASQRLPRTVDFIGRQNEESYYAWRLQTEGLIHIWGLPGSGKTALAAELAADGRRYGQTILWHTCQPGPESTTAGILKGLAQAFASAGDERLWHKLRQTPSDMWDLPAMMELLREQLLARPAVIVIDNAHRAVVEDTSALFEMLKALVSRRAARIMIVSRTCLESGDWEVLPGLTERECRLLWTGLPPLPDEQWQALYKATAGLPHPLRRVATAYRRSGEFARPNDWREEVAAWVQDEIWDRLSDYERRLLTVAHAFEGRPWASHAPLVLAALAIKAEAIDQVQLSGLLTMKDSCMHVHSALQSSAKAALEADVRLNSLLKALAATIAETAPVDVEEVPHKAEVTKVAPTPSSENTDGELPTGLDLLARVRDVLEHSADYLGRNAEDGVARRLLNELETLQAALPDPAGLNEKTRKSVPDPQSVSSSS